jgi:hypothetical protein
LSFPAPGFDIDHRDLEAQQRLLREQMTGFGWLTPRILAHLHDTPDLYLDQVAQVVMDRRSSPHDDDRVERLLGREWADRVEFHQEHPGEPGAELVGTVRPIQAVTCSRQLEDRPGMGEVYLPVPLSGALRHVDTAEPWLPERSEDERDRATFDGWIVEVDRQ